LLLMVLAPGTALAQNTVAVITRAETAMGNVQSVRYEGTGRMGAVGMNWNPTGPWHFTRLDRYVRTIDYAARSSREDITRNQENPPMLGGEAPFVDEIREGRHVSGLYAWNQPAAGSPPSEAAVARPAVAAAAERQLQIWLTPHGFLKAAAKHHATVQTKRDGGKPVTVLTFAAGVHRFVGTIDSRNLVTKVQAWIPNAVLGDMPVDTTYSDYKAFGRMHFPTHIVQEQGGHVTLDLTVASAQANPANAADEAPEAARTTTLPPVQVITEKLGEGIWLLRPGHNSVLVEFKDYVVVIEAPEEEPRSQAVIAEVKKLVPNKPIRYVMNTHHHFDHSGGLRTYVAEGAAVITHEGNKAFYEWAWKQPRTLEPDDLAKHPREATFVTYKTKYVLTDGTRSLEVHLTVGDNHDEFLSFAYLPKEKILVEADDWSDWYATPLSLPLWNNLLGNLQRLKLDVETLVPLHGKAASMTEWLKVLREKTGYTE
jgi:hypothetical protein